MVKLIAGLAGSGKTKAMIEMVNKAASEEKGQVVCIERGTKLRYDVKSAARLIDSSEYEIKGFRVMRGFLSGLCAGNFDISHIFVDSLHKVAHVDDIDELEEFAQWMEEFHGKHGVSFTVSVGVREDKLTGHLKGLL